MIKKLVAGVFALSLVVGAQAQTSTAENFAPFEGATLYVDAANPNAGDGTAASPYQSIQAAVDAANAGDTIKIAAGEYKTGTTAVKLGDIDSLTRVVVDKRLHLEGAGRGKTVVLGADATVEADEDGLGDDAVRCLYLTADAANSLIEGITFKGANTIDVQSDGVVIDDKQLFFDGDDAKVDFNVLDGAELVFDGIEKGGKISDKVSINLAKNARLAYGDNMETGSWSDEFNAAKLDGRTNITFREKSLVDNKINLNAANDDLTVNIADKAFVKGELTVEDKAVIKQPIAGAYGDDAARPRHDDRGRQVRRRLLPSVKRRDAAASLGDEICSGRANRHPASELRFGSVASIRHRQEPRSAAAGCSEAGGNSLQDS